MGWTHFDLGPAGDARVRVQWPDGEMTPWMQATANQFVDIARLHRGAAMDAAQDPRKEPH